MNYNIFTNSISISRSDQAPTYINNKNKMTTCSFVELILLAH